MENAIQGRGRRPQEGVSEGYAQHCFRSIMESGISASMIARLADVDAGSIVRFVNNVAKNPDRHWALSFDEQRTVMRALAKLSGGRVGHSRPPGPRHPADARLDAALDREYRHRGRTWSGD